MRLLRPLFVVAILGWPMLHAAQAQASERPVRIIMPYAAGSVGDVLARMLAESLRTSLNRPVIVENKLGAAGRIGVQAVKDAPADGSVLLFTPIAPMAVFPHVYDKLGYDAVADFQPISQIATFDLAVAVAPNVPAKSLKELVTWLKANPDKTSYGSPAAGSLPHFFAVLFANTAKLDLRHVPYKGNTPGITDLIGGHLPMFFTSTQDLVENHKGGRLRILATSGERRSTAVPDVPTFKEAGYAIRGEGWYGMYAPARTPPDVIARLNKAVVAAVRSHETMVRMAALGVQPTGTSSESHVQIQKTDSDLWRSIVKASGFRAER